MGVTVNVFIEEDMQI